MKSHVTCNEIREESFSQLRGEASALEQQRFTSHLERCDDCRCVVSEVSDLVETVRAQRFTPAPDQRDRMLEETLTRIETVQCDDEDPFAPVPLHKGRARKAVLFALPVAAALLVGFFGTLVLVERPDSGAQKGDAPVVADAGGEGDTGLDALRTVRPAAELELGVEKGTRWSFREDEKRLFLEVEAGTLLIQFHHLPAQRDLVVHGPGAEVHVVGTVLMVRANTTETMEVGVVEGKIEVKEGGDTVALTAGQYRTSQGNIVEMSHLDKELASMWLDDKERPEKKDRARKVRRKRRAKKDRPARARAEQPRLDEMTVRDLYDLAEKELSRGEFAKAARLLEKLVAKSPRSSRADTARLDLARLYAGPLGHPQKARRHLNAYLRRHPSGAESDLVRRMLSDLDNR